MLMGISYFYSPLRTRKRSAMRHAGPPNLPPFMTENKVMVYARMYPPLEHTSAHWVDVHNPGFHGRVN